MIGTTCCNDTGKLKTDSLGYVNINLNPISPPLTGAFLLDKSRRGWAHPQLAILLLPVDYEPTKE